MPLRFLTAGESHGKGLIGILEGMPAGLNIDLSRLQQQMARRKLGHGRGARQKIETDEVEILSGVRFGKTLGSPIGLLIKNRDWQNWSAVMQVEPGDYPKERHRRVEVPRPGHADLPGGIKYKHEDLRNVLERASARETAMRVALASFARELLEALGIFIGSHVTEIGPIKSTDDITSIKLEQLITNADSSPVRCVNPDISNSMVEAITHAKSTGDTLGGIFEVVATGLPVGLGSYAQWDRRLEGKIAQSFMSLNAIKAVEIGMGKHSAALPGSKAHDEILPNPQQKNGKVYCYATNRSGGIDGGVTNGQSLLIRAAMKPLSTLMQPLRSVNLLTGEPTTAHIERSDVCAVPAASVIAESLLALTLAEAILEKFGGDSMEELIPRFNAWRDS